MDRLAIFVPQKVYQPYTEADRLRYIRDAQLKETIFFYSSQSELGISLDDALKQRLKNMKDKEDQMFVGLWSIGFDSPPGMFRSLVGQATVPGRKQIPTMDFKNPKGPITKVKLAKNIANCVRRFIEAVECQGLWNQTPIEGWRVGKATHQG
ncbi:hypothetical protein BU15DRAFT_71047 [Melanogaster broomeanus]|nr:hypothetical protein BU15DRAFT_71047 [Melanogaster broomeanus]